MPFDRQEEGRTLRPPLLGHGKRLDADPHAIAPVSTIVSIATPMTIAVMVPVMVTVPIVAVEPDTQTGREFVVVSGVPAIAEAIADHISRGG